MEELDEIQKDVFESLRNAMTDDEEWIAKAAIKETISQMTEFFKPLSGLIHDWNAEDDLQEQFPEIYKVLFE